MTNDRVPDKGSSLCQRLLGNIDSALATTQAARLTESQFESVKQLREEVERLCAENRNAEAEQAEKRALAIIKGGPPAL